MITAAPTTLEEALAALESARADLAALAGVSKDDLIARLLSRKAVVELEQLVSRFERRLIAEAEISEARTRFESEQAALADVRRPFAEAWQQLAKLLLGGFPPDASKETHKALHDLAYQVATAFAGAQATGLQAEMTVIDGVPLLTTSPLYNIERRPRALRKGGSPGRSGQPVTLTWPDGRVSVYPSKYTACEALGASGARTYGPGKRMAELAAKQGVKIS